ncbi:MAG: adenylate/guanylate cyclase domain-containing protein [Chloroflexi bacterium]|nr:adenylate/guanylate cyclase domain-containing protein [Chloroflexota bacterium]
MASSSVTRNGWPGWRGTANPAELPRSARRRPPTDCVPSAHHAVRTCVSEDARVTLPTGTVTFFFSDIEGSTRHARQLEPAAWIAALEAHDRLVDGLVRGHGGAIVKHEGDGVFAVFVSAGDALAAAVAFQRSVATDGLGGLAGVKIRIGLHTGEGQLTSGGRDYVGVDVHYAARVANAANGGQIAISDSTALLVADHPLPGSRLEDTGLARLKDFDEPRRLHRLVVAGVADDPRPLRALGPPSNLPEPISVFVGRDAELSDVLALIRSSRLVTLTGPGGSGKTRLAIATAERLVSDLPDGVWYVPLAAVEDASLVASAVATALSIEEEAGRPLGDTLRSTLAGRQLLLVLDNFEQVIAAVRLVADLLSGARGVRAIVTSREALRIAGEQEYRVPPLGGLDAVSLFVDRARRPARVHRDRRERRDGRGDLRAA